MKPSNTKPPELPKDLLVLNGLSTTATPSFCVNTHVWNQDETIHPWYAFFYCGTNNLVIFKSVNTAKPKKRLWKCIRLEDIELGHMHVIIWKWTMKTDKLDSDFRELTIERERENRE